MTELLGREATPSLVSDLLWQALRAVIIFAFGGAAALVFHSEVVAGAAVAAASALAAATPALAAYGFGVWKTLRHHRQSVETTGQSGCVTPGSPR